MFDIARSLFEFIIFTVIIKIIVGHWLAEQIMKLSRVMLAKNGRYWAIFMHYQHQAAGEGHSARSVLNCGEQRCATL